MPATETKRDRYSSVSLTTNASGAATGYVTIPAGGFVEKVAVTLGTLASGAADVTLTCETTGETVLGLTNIAGNSVDYPRREEDTTAGAGTSTYTRMFIPERVKIVIAQGGDTKTGTVVVVWSIT